MKPLLLIVFLVSGTLGARAQQYPKVEIIQPTDSARMLQKGSMFLSPGLHFLPQDNMPCLAPDMTGLQAMPNAWSGGRDLKNAPGVISPNPARPFRYEYRPERKKAPAPPRARERKKDLVTG